MIGSNIVVWQKLYIVSGSGEWKWIIIKVSHYTSNSIILFKRDWNKVKLHIVNMRAVSEKEV